VAAVSLLTLGSCSADGDAAPSQSAAPSAGSSSTAGDASTGPATGVEPASGPAVSARQFRVNLPAGYRLAPREAYSWTARAPRSADVVGVSAAPAFGASGVDAVARLTMRSVVTDPPLEREDDVELDGTTAFHLVSDGRWTERHLVGAGRGGQLLTLDFSLDTTTPRAQRDALVASVLASWQWR
jgi:hypothetical protein